MTKSKKDKQAHKRNAANRRQKRSKKAVGVGHARPLYRDNAMPPAVVKPAHFENFEIVADYAKQSVYHITRLREVDSNLLQVPLGTGFLIGKNRLMTCSHCIFNDANVENPMSQHQDGDRYMLVQRDEIGNYHTVIIDPKLDQELHCYPAIDAAIFYLPDSFYKVDGKWVKNPESHLVFRSNPSNIGSDAGVLGYPLTGLVITEAGIPNIGKIYIRGDRGVVNTRHFSADVYQYEFTMAFNPGNSGGPILRIDDGCVIGMVHGYMTHTINQLTTEIRPPGASQDEAIQIVTPLTTNYSVGYASENYKKLAAEHGLAFDFS